MGRPPPSPGPVAFDRQISLRIASSGIHNKPNKIADGPLCFRIFRSRKGQRTQKPRRSPSTQRPKGPGESPTLRRQLRDTRKRLRELERRLRKLERSRASGGGRT